MEFTLFECTLFAAILVYKMIKVFQRDWKKQKDITKPE